jgi:Kef-type K+ transport system membrane component KefB
MLSRRAALVFGVADLLTAAVVGLGVFVALPARWWPVDVVAAALTALELAAGVGLVRQASWGERVARVASAVALCAGIFAVTMLAVTASWLRGVYGPVGAGGAIILALVLLLAIPYVVVLPAVELVWLGVLARARE